MTILYVAIGVFAGMLLSYWGLIVKEYTKSWRDWGADMEKDEFDPSKYDMEAHEALNVAASEAAEMRAIIAEYLSTPGWWRHHNDDFRAWMDRARESTTKHQRYDD